MSVVGDTPPEVILTSDASGRWGCGAYWDAEWFQVEWRYTARPKQANIATKEMIPIVIAWGRRWAGMVVCCRCDNNAVVAVLNNRTSKEELVHYVSPNKVQNQV